MRATVVVHSLIPPRVAIPVNTPVTCILTELNSQKEKITRFRQCTYVSMPDHETGKMKQRWILHNAIGMIEVYPVAWVQFLDNETTCSSIEWLQQLHSWGRVDFKF